MRKFLTMLILLAPFAFSADESAWGASINAMRLGIAVDRSGPDPVVRVLLENSSSEDRSIWFSRGSVVLFGSIEGEPRTVTLADGKKARIVGPWPAAISPAPEGLPGSRFHPPAIVVVDSGTTHEFRFTIKDHSYLALQVQAKFPRSAATLPDTLPQWSGELHSGKLPIASR